MAGHFDDDVKETLEEARNRRLLQDAQRTKLLSDQIESLDKMSNDVQERWSSPNDFARVDLVCAELLKRGSFVDALRYMERVEQVTKVICQKLRAPAAREMAGMDPVGDDDSAGGATVRFDDGGSGGEGNGHDGGDGGEKSKAEVAAASAAAAAAAAAEGRKDATKNAANEKRKARAEASAKTLAAREEEARERDRATIRDMTVEIKDLRSKLMDLEKATEESSSSLKQKERSMNGLIERGNQRSVELQSAQAKAANMERLNRELLERVDGLTLLLKQTEAKSKSSAAKARHYRERLSAAEARGYVPAADMATLPPVTSTSTSRGATPTPPPPPVGGGGGAGGAGGGDSGGDEGEAAMTTMDGGGATDTATATGRLSSTGGIFTGGGGDTHGSTSGGGVVPSGRGYREAMQEKMAAAQEALKASEAQVAKAKRLAAQTKAAATRAVDDATRLVALCLERGGVSLDDLTGGPDPDPEYLAKATEAVKTDQQMMDSIGLGKTQLAARAARAAEQEKQRRAASRNGAMKREKGWNDTGAVKNPLAATSKDDNWRKQQLIKAQRNKTTTTTASSGIGGGGGGGGGVKKKRPPSAGDAAAAVAAVEADAAAVANEGAGEE